MYRVEFASRAQRMFRNLPADVQRRLDPAIQALSQNPRPSGCKKLSGEESVWRIRVGDYRIIYQIRDNELLVLRRQGGAPPRNLPLALWTVSTCGFPHPPGDKEARAKPISAQAKAGKVKLARGLWNDEFRPLTLCTGALLGPAYARPPVFRESVLPWWGCLAEAAGTNDAMYHMPLVLAGLVVALVLLACLGAFLSWRRRLLSQVLRGSEIAETAKGRVEFARVGTGPVILNFHGGATGYDQTLALSWNLHQAGFRSPDPVPPWLFAHASGYRPRPGTGCGRGGRPAGRARPR